MKLRLTVKAADAAAAAAALDAEEVQLRALIGRAVFGVDEETMECAIGNLLLGRNLTLAVAESLTGGLLASRIVSVAGASRWFRGGVVSYATDVKQSLLDVPAGPVVSAETAAAMAASVAKLLGAGVGLATTGVAGPDTQDDQPPGTVYAGVALPDRDPEGVRLRVPGDRDRVRQMGTISVLDVLRQRLLDS
jgi:nicotinamide-nucleotide amidase